jgi:hypothetical protein
MDALIKMLDMEGRSEILSLTFKELEPRARQFVEDFTAAGFTAEVSAADPDYSDASREIHKTLLARIEAKLTLARPGDSYAESGFEFRKNALSP